MPKYRIRSLKPEFFLHHQLGAMTDRERLLFIGMICHADDEGILPADAKLLRALIFGLTDTRVEDVEAALQALASTGSVVLYEVEEVRYAFLPGWKEHQRIDKPKPSRYPRSLKNPGTWRPRRVDDASETCRAASDPIRSDPLHSDPGVALEVEVLENLKPLDTAVPRDTETALESRKVIEATPIARSPRRVCLDRYAELFEALAGTAPHVSPKDEAGLDTVIAAHGLENTLAALGAWFTSTDPFFAQQGFKLQFLPSAYNRVMLPEPRAIATHNLVEAARRLAVERAERGKG